MEIVQLPEPILAKKCAPLDVADLVAGTYTSLIEQMRADMIAHNGIGLAANQIGKDLSLFVIEAQLAADNQVSDVFANPEITEYGKEKDSAENEHSHDDADRGQIEIQVVDAAGNAGSRLGKKW